MVVIEGMTLSGHLWIINEMKVFLFCWFDHFLDSRAEICQIFRWFFGKFKAPKRHSEINWPSIHSIGTPHPLFLILMVFSSLLNVISIVFVPYFLGGKYLVFASSHSVKMREFSFLSLYTFWGKCVVFFQFLNDGIHNYVFSDIIVNFIIQKLKK